MLRARTGKGTVYRFTVDRVPKYIGLDKDRVTPVHEPHEAEE
jgi:hypothetical protein